MGHGLKRNNEGYYDPTAYNAILNVTLEEHQEELRLDQFMTDLLILCKKNDYYISGDLMISDRRHKKKYSKKLSDYNKKIYIKNGEICKKF